jgi:hypothetical protein
LTDIFHEVEEDLRRDRLNKVWARYGSIFLAIAVLAVAATAGVVWWRQHQRDQAAAAAQSFSDAGALAESGKIDESLAAFGAIAGTGGAGYPELALFRQAGLLIAKNDVPGALALYDRIANSAADERLKGLARLRAAYAVADTEAPEVLKNRVAALAAEGPWRFAARELQAFADFRAGNVKAAADAYAALAADAGAPDGLKARAAKFAVFLAGGAVIPPPPAAAPAVEPAPADPAAAPAVPATPPADAPQ